MKKSLIIGALLLAMTGMKAQEVSPLYEELPNPVATDVSKWAKVNAPVIAWGSTDVRYNKELPAQVIPGTPMNLIGWMGEKLSTQFVISTNRDLKNVSVEVGDIVAKNYKISKCKCGYIGPYAYDEYLKGNYLPCSGKTRIEF